MVRGLLRLLGWLLTPLVAWAASFAGAALGAAVSGGADNPIVSLGISAGFGLVFALAAALLWLRLIRRSRKLRETLALADDGTPLMALEADPPEKAP